jgi:hypothetical protein
VLRLVGGVREFRAQPVGLCSRHDRDLSTGSEDQHPTVLRGRPGEGIVIEAHTAPSSIVPVAASWCFDLIMSR